VIRSEWLMENLRDVEKKGSFLGSDEFLGRFEVEFDEVWIESEESVDDF
jgi:hypothetical protein